ncbi:class I SAM-dependent methyltransferase family protein [bacterium]|nr:class I SAM-dependent methyltransferase family protein [Methanomicrobia archaeon]MCD6147910.1 class I SAM-dependent methyltransferase family protein [bacterium]
MLGLKVRKIDGEETRKKLIQRGILDRRYRIKNLGDYLVFPISKRIDGDIVEMEFELLEKRDRYDFKFEMIGDIAIIEDKYDPSILKRKNIRSVYRKTGDTEGIYRIKKYEYVAGEKNTETIHKEYGCRYMLDIRKVYFNPRLATERYRIAEKVRDGERILDMFAGVGPFSILIAKKKNVEIHSIDINPDAFYYLKKNIEINKVRNVFPYLGDCREIVKELPDFDRIIMNLPKSSLDFMDTALKKIKKNGIIHLYSIKQKEEIKYNVIDIQKVKSYSPRVYVWRYDIKP